MTIWCSASSAVIRGQRRVETSLYRVKRGQFSISTRSAPPTRSGRSRKLKIAGSKKPPIRLFADEIARLADRLENVDSDETPETGLGVTLRTRLSPRAFEPARTAVKAATMRERLPARTSARCLRYYPDLRINPD